MAQIGIGAALFAMTAMLAAMAPARAADEPRIVIGLYANRDDSHVRDNRLFQAAEMPLNHLGLVLEPYNALRGVPQLRERGDVRGVLLWFERDDLPVPAETFALVAAAVERRIPVIIMEDVPGVSGGPAAQESIQRALALIGVRGMGDFRPYSFDMRVAELDAEIAGFERNFEGVLAPTDTFAAGAGARAALTLERSDGTRTSPIVITEKGAFVAPGYAIWSRADSGQARWYVNPFALFSRVYATDMLPKADPTTLSGRRIYYSQIDGDGWLNISSVEGYAARRALASEVILKEAVAPHPDLPVTVAPVAADLDPRFAGTQATQDIARAFFALPQVETGGHTYTHPFQWSYFAPQNYSAADELGYRRYYAKTLLAPGYDAGAGGARSPLEEGYLAPRAYGDIPFSLAREIRQSAAYISSFAPAEKPVRILQWSGDTEPFPEALAEAAAAGLANINGGDTRMDREFGSYLFVAPYGRLAGGHRQIYASTANENIYTDGWQRNYSGFRHVLQTLANTETPRRVAAANVYYHTYSGEREAALRAVKDVLDAVSRMEMAPVATSRYAAIAQGFYTARFEHLSPLAWRVRDRGALATVRFDDASALNVDYAASEGILGDRRAGDALYVALDGANSAPLIVLRQAAAGQPSRLVLADSRWEISNLRQTDGAASFSARGFGPGEMRWRAPPGQSWRAEAHYAGKMQTAEAFSADDGMLTLVMPRGAEDGVSVRMTRLAGAVSR